MFVGLILGIIAGFSNIIRAGKKEKLLMQDLTKVVEMVTKCNWLLLVLVAMVTVMTTSMSFYMGVVAGGLIVAVNFHLLKRTIEKDIRPRRSWKRDGP